MTARSPEPAYISEFRALITHAQQWRSVSASHPPFPRQSLKTCRFEAAPRKPQPGRSLSAHPGAPLQCSGLEAGGPAPHRSASCGSKKPHMLLRTSERADWTCKGAPSCSELQEIMVVAACEGTFGGICGGQLLAAVFQETLEKGKICLSTGELVDAVFAAGATSRPEAVGIVQAAWESGSVRCHCSMPRALQPHLFMRDLEKPEVGSASLLLPEICVSPVCKRLTWSLLLTVLRCLNHEKVRSSLDIILLVCRGVFGLECGEWDVIAAAALAPQGACKIGTAPWPVQQQEGMGDESLMLATTVITLNDALQDEASKVIPAYSPKLAPAVEAEFCMNGLDIQAIGSWLEANLSELTLPMILVLVGSQQTASPCVPGGVLIWFWEKMHKMRSQQTETSSDRETSTDVSRQGTTEEEPTPLEAFISCFYEDLRSKQPLVLSQLNNLYRMRSRGHDINYQSHGYSRLAEFLAEVPGVVLVSSGNQMAVKAGDPVKLAEVAEQVTQGLRKRAADLRARGVDTSLLEISYRRPQGVPRKILARIWDLFQHARNHEIPVAQFISFYKERFPNEKLHFKSLGYQDVRGLMAYVPFVEKVGGRRQSKYVLKAAVAQPGGYHGRPAGPGPFPPVWDLPAGQTHRSQWPSPSALSPPGELFLRQEGDPMQDMPRYLSMPTESEQSVLPQRALSLIASAPTPSGGMARSSVSSASPLQQTVSANASTPSMGRHRACQSSIPVARQEYFERTRTQHCNMPMRAYQ